jgi:hypothetical protein
MPLCNDQESFTMALSLSAVLVAASVSTFGVLGVTTAPAAPTPTPIAPATPVAAGPVLASFTTNDSDWRRFRCDDWWQHRDRWCFRDDHHDRDNRNHHRFDRRRDWR